MYPSFGLALAWHQLSVESAERDIPFLTAAAVRCFSAIIRFSTDSVLSMSITQGMQQEGHSVEKNRQFLFWFENASNAPSLHTASLFIQGSWRLLIQGFRWTRTLPSGFDFNWFTSVSCVLQAV